MKLPLGPSRYVIPLTLGTAFAWLTYLLVGWKWFLFLLSCLLYEGWTLINQYPHDTITETMWALMKRPLIPFLLGGASVALLIFILPLTLEGLFIAFLLGMLMGHWVFQAQRVYENGHEAPPEKS